MSYYNTTNEKGETLKRNKRKGKRQDEKLLEWFTNYQYGTPSQAHACMPNSPLTSVRRAISSLTEKGLLVKTDKKRVGPYGRHEYIWKLAVSTATIEEELI